MENGQLVAEKYNALDRCAKMNEAMKTLQREKEDLKQKVQNAFSKLRKEKQKSKIFWFEAEKRDFIAKKQDDVVLRAKVHVGEETLKTVRKKLDIVKKSRESWSDRKRSRTIAGLENNLRAKKRLITTLVQGKVRVRVKHYPQKGTRKVFEQTEC